MPVSTTTVGGVKTVTWDTTMFLEKFRQLGYKLNKTNTDYVRDLAGQLATKLAQLTPITKLHIPERGRARAGWWPALLALGRRNASTKHPNAGEGKILDGSKNKQNPSVMIENSVSYIRNMKPYGIGWFYQATSSIERRMAFQLEYAYRHQINKSGFGATGGM